MDLQEKSLGMLQKGKDLILSTNQNIQKYRDSYREKGSKLTSYNKQREETLRNQSIRYVVQL